MPACAHAYLFPFCVPKTKNRMKKEKKKKGFNIDAFLIVQLAMMGCCLYLHRGGNDFLALIPLLACLANILYSYVCLIRMLARKMEEEQKGKKEGK